MARKPVSCAHAIAGRTAGVPLVPLDVYNHAMLKIAFWILLIANIAAFGLHRGLLSSGASGREPERLNAQINPDKIRVFPPGTAVAPGAQRIAPPSEAMPPAAPAPSVTPAPAPAVPATQASTPASASPVGACVQIGNFAAPEADLFQAQLAPLQLGDRLTRITFREISSYIVFIPSQGSREAANKKTEELQRLGVTDYFVFQDPSPLQWAISLGVFKAEDLARTHLAMLSKKGVDPVRIAARKGGAPRFAFQLRELDAETRSRVDAVQAAFPGQQQKNCETQQNGIVIIAARSN